MKKEERIIFFGMLLIIIGIFVKITSELLTFIIVIVGAYFVVKGIVNLKKIKKKK